MTNSNDRVVYVTREIERAMGMEPSADYLIVSNETAYGNEIRSKYPDFVTLIKSSSGELLGTTELLAHPTTRELVNSTKAGILVFKNTLRVESVIKANGWKVLNPPSYLSERVENKLTQLRWLGPLGSKYLPPHAAKVAKTVTWKNSEPFILQWAHGHTGDGTMLVHTPDELRSIQERFPERMARLTAYVNGPSFTVNVVVTPQRVLLANPSYQITGMQPFADNEFSTVGNDWGLAEKILGKEGSQSLETMSKEIGLRLQGDGWRGLFGIDAIRDEAHGRLYLIEVNARQPASTTFESELESAERDRGARGLTTFEAHMRALLGLPIDQDIIRIRDGAQIIQRVNKNVQSVFDDVPDQLRKSGFNVVSYENTSANADLLRVQSATGIMQAHKEFNDRGRLILNTVKSSQFKIEV